MLHIGLKIKELASKENLDVSQLAAKLGKSKQAVYDLFSKEDVHTSVLRELSGIFNVPIIAFFQEGEDANKDIQAELEKTKAEVERLNNVVMSLRAGKVSPTKVVVEFDVSPDEFIKMGLKDKIVQVLNK